MPNSFAASGTPPMVDTLAPEGGTPAIGKPMGLGWEGRRAEEKGVVG